jgi:metallo-beta-lactamase class B
MVGDQTMKTKITNNHPGLNIQKSFKLILAILFLYSTSHLPVSAQLKGPSEFSPAEDDPQRTELIEPFKIVDNIYSVGAVVHYPSFLITSSQGHIIIDTSLDEFVPAIASNIKKLGFNVEDVKYLLTTQSHIDHVGGHAQMQEITGATTMATAPDADVMESGGKTDFRDGGTWAPVKVDRIIEDLETIRLGDIALTAHVTPGHTKGCTTWTTKVEENGKNYDVVLVCGLRMNPNEPLINNADYPNMASDFAYAFAVLKTLPVDFYLSSHGYWFDLKEKIELMKRGGTANPFIDPEGYYRILGGFEKAFLEQLKIERELASH